MSKAELKQILRKEAELQKQTAKLMKERNKKQKAIKYFCVDVMQNKTIQWMYNLKIYRWMKEKEAEESGLGKNPRWVYVGEIRGTDERNAMCIKHMLESPREPLPKDKEYKDWLKEAKKFKTGG